MFSSLSENTAIFIDHSNIFYAKYTVGWYFDVEKLLDYCNKNEKISLVGFYGAYDNKKLEQYNRVQNLIKKYNSDKFQMYFKPLEQHGSKNKGNVDTEMGFDLSEFKGNYDTLVLFSGDGDFAYPLKKLISQGKKVIISSTKGHVSGLVNLTHEYKNGECKFLDFNNSRHADSVELRSIIKDTDKGLALSPHLQEFITRGSSSEIKELYEFVKCMIEKTYYNNNQAKFLSINDKNGFPIYKNIKRWDIEEKELLLKYLGNLI